MANYWWESRKKIDKNYLIKSKLQKKLYNTTENSWKLSTAIQENFCIDGNASMPTASGVLGYMLRIMNWQVYSWMVP